MQTVNWAGSSYNIPNQRGDTPWSGLSDFAIAVAAKGINTNGGAFTLLADINFGATFGVVSTYFKSRTANIATAGILRLASADTIQWRNNANGADISLSKNTSDQLLWNGSRIILAGGGLIVNADISASAAIAFSKMAALTVSRALVSDGAGVVTVATTTATEIGYVNGVTSAIQTQLNARPTTGVGVANSLAYYTGAAAIAAVTAITAARALVSDANGLPVASVTTTTELSYVNGVTSAIQTQLNNKSTGNNAPQNILINGGFDFWQRNTTFSSPATNAFTTDQWKADLGGSPTYTVSRDTANTHGGSGACVKLEVTVVNSATTCRLFQSIENFQEYRGRAVTLSAWIKTSALNVKIALYDGSTFTESSAHTGSGNYELLTLTVTLSASAADFAAFFGFLQTTVNTGAVYIDDVFLNLGSVAVTYTPKNYQTEFAQCQRYFEKSYEPLTVPATNTTVGESYTTSLQADGSNYVGTIFFQVRKYAVPTITFYRADGTSGSWQGMSTAGSNSNITPSALNPATHMFRVQNGTNSSPTLHGHWIASAGY